MPKLIETVGDSDSDSVSSDERDIPAKPEAERLPPKWALYMLLGVTVLIYGAIGPLFRLVVAPSTMVKAIWQLSTIVTLLFIPFVFTFVKLIFVEPALLLDVFFTVRTFALIVAAGSSFGFACVTWYWAVEHTSISHACLFHETHPLILTLFMNLYGLFSSGGKCCCFTWASHPSVRVPDQNDEELSTLKIPNRQQNFGTVVGFLCILVMSLHESSASSGVTHEGDMIALMGAFGMVGFLLVSPRLSRTLPVSLYLIWVYIVMVAMVVVCCMFMDRPYNWKYGVAPGSQGEFLFHHNEWWMVMIVFLQDKVVIAQVMCSAGSSALAVFCVSFLSQHFSPQSLAICLLGETVVATFFAVAVRAGPPPGWVTYAGGLVLLFAIAVTVTAETPEPAPPTRIIRKRFPRSRHRHTIPSKLRLGDGGSDDDGELAGLMVEDGYRSESPVVDHEGSVFSRDHGPDITASDLLNSYHAVLQSGSGASYEPRLSRSVSADTIHVSRLSEKYRRDEEQAWENRVVPREDSTNSMSIN